MAELTITRDREELERLEGIIEENIGAFYRVGKALMKIRDEQLYSKVRGIENFETYCRQRWDFNSSRARQLMAATETYENIKTVTPRNAIEAEFHLRPLSKLKDNPEVQREAWREAVETAPEGKVTAAHVQKVVKTYQLKGGEDGEAKVAGEDIPAGDSFVLSELKRLWKRATKKEKASFQQWMKERENEL